MFNPFVIATSSGFFGATSSLTVGSPGIIFGYLPLTDAGGTISILSFSEGSYGAGLQAIAVDSTYRQATQGEITGVAVPEGPSAILTVIGLAILGLYRFRRTLARLP